MFMVAVKRNPQPLALVSALVQLYMYALKVAKAI